MNTKDLCFQQEIVKRFALDLVPATLEGNKLKKILAGYDPKEACWKVGCCDGWNEWAEYYPLEFFEDCVHAMERACNGGEYIASCIGVNSCN